MNPHYSSKTILILIFSGFIICSATESDQDLITEPVEISLNPYVGRLVTVNALAGDETLKLLFDTGGGKTYITPDAARRLSCKPSGRSIGFRMSGEIVESENCDGISLSVDGISFHHAYIGVWDINSILPEDLPRLDGILSLKTFQNQPFTLDLSTKRLILETKESLENRTKTMTRLESRIATGPAGGALTIFLRGEIRESEDYGWFLLDSGNLDAVIVSQHMVNNNITDSTASSVTWESEISLGNLSSVSVKFRTKEIIYDGALSEAFLRKWIFTFDLSNNAVWASPAENASSE